LQAIPLLGFAVEPSAALAIALCFASAAGGAYHLGLQRRFLAAVPESVRAQGFGLVYSGIPALPGIMIMIAGALAAVCQPAEVIVLFGLACGVAGVTLLRPRPAQEASSSSAASQAVSTPDGS